MLKNGNLLNKLVADALMRASLSSALVFAIASALSSCADRPLEGVLVPVTTSAQGTSRVQILVATTRQRSDRDPGEMFGGERAPNVSFATITVSIPPDSAREVGRVQWPQSLPGDPAKHFVTISANHLDRESFRRTIASSAKETGRRRVLIFIHGFNNRFDDAVYRFAQIVHDSKAPGIPVLFTWPSRGEVKLRSYTYDRESANYSRDALEELLDDLAAEPSISEINIVAHSMGNWVTLEALRGRAIRAARFADRMGRIPDKAVQSDKVKNAFLVAPDVDIDVFRKQIRRMGVFRPRFMLFVSQDDVALAASGMIWGGMQRLGDIDPAKEPYVSEFMQDRIEVFDLTKIKSSGGSAHGRAFDDITTVLNLIRSRLPDLPPTLVR